MKYWLVLLGTLTSAIAYGWQEVVLNKELNVDFDHSGLEMKIAGKGSAQVRVNFLFNSNDWRYFNLRLWDGIYQFWECGTQFSGVDLSSVSDGEQWILKIYRTGGVLGIDVNGVNKIEFNTATSPYPGCKSWWGNASKKITKISFMSESKGVVTHYRSTGDGSTGDDSSSIATGASECYLENTDLWGGDLKNFKTLKKDAAECLEACSRYPDCVAFTMRQSDGRCWIKHEGYKEGRNRNGLVSGKMECFNAEKKPEPESDYENVARFANVTVDQSGSRWGGGAEKAIDANINTRWDVGGCSYTSDSYLNYWQITLQKAYQIDHVLIYGLSDKWNNDDGIMNGAHLIIGGQLCEVVSGMKEKATEGHKFTCKGDDSKRTGKVVRIENWYKKMVVCEVQVMVRKDLVADDAPPTMNPTLASGQEIDDFYNVAYKKKASQSSVHGSAYASKAVDGWAIQDWRGSSGSCSHTGRDELPVYWKVDLGRVYQIDHIRVWGRNDGTSYRIAGAMLWVDENLCGRLKDMKKDGAEVVKCDKELMAGRYVTISKNREYMHLCEVQVMVKKKDIDTVPKPTSWPGERVDGFTNVALNSPLFNENSTAVQTSTHSDGWARRANDGSRDGHYNNGKSVTHTSNRGPQWWQVDLGRAYKIHHITIYGRTDCCSERIQGARVTVGRSTQVGDYLKKPTKPADPITIDVSTDNIYGRKVAVEIVNQYLSLAEVEIWVANEDVTTKEVPTVVPTWEDVAIRRPTNQSSTGWGHTADRAVDNFPDRLSLDREGSCTHTYNYALNWWEVDLEKGYHIDHIVVLGRTDKHQERLNGATLEVDGRTVAGFNYQSEQHKWEFPLNGLKGQLVRIVTKNEYLSLCEVKVMVNHDFEPKDSDEPINRDEVNLASTASVSASSSLYGTVPSLATDGNIDADFFSGSCWFSGPGQNDIWLKLELKKRSNVRSVTVYPRLDYNAHRDIDGAVVRVGTAVCGTIRYKLGNLYYEVDCEGATGSQVTVSKLGNLVICEIVVQEVSNQA